MHVRRVRSPEDVEVLRKLRNHTRRHMTRHKKYITKAQQQKWWDAEPRRAYLYGDVAFAYIKREAGRNYITLGVHKKARGQGIGTLIYRTFRPCFAEINADNEASIRAAEKAGYRPVRTIKDGQFVEDKKVVMKG